MSAASICLLLPLLTQPPQEGAPSIENAARTRQAIEFRSNNSPGNRDPATGSLTVEYGKREYSDEEALALLDSPVGTRFSPSAGLPATYDVDVPLVFGKTRLEPGLYLVLLERIEGGWQLVFVSLGAALEAGWTGGEAIPGAGKVVAAQATEHRDGNQPGHRLWTGPGEKERGLAFRAQVGRLSLSAALEAKAKKGKPAASEAKRRRSTLRAGPDGAVLASVEHGVLEWGPESESALGQLKSGKRWGLGRYHWTNLIVLAPLELGGTRVPAGEYALVLERGKGDAAWTLALLDSAARRKAFTNLHAADGLEAALRVALAHEVPAVSADELDARFVGEEAARLEFHCGPHRWSAAVARGR